jgi:mediator of RNA polymerase II transcription subunit 16
LFLVDLQSPNRAAGFTFDLATEVVAMLKIAVDYSEDAHHDNLVRNAPLQMMFSVINHLGFHGQYKPRSFCGKFAWLALNARNIIILVTIASNTPITVREKLSPLDESGMPPNSLFCCNAPGFGF